MDDMLLASAMPPGTNTSAPLDLPAAFWGSWSGLTGNLAGGDPYEVTITLEEDQTWSLYGFAGFVDYPSLGMTAPLQMVYPINCYRQVAGDAPVGQCYQLVENFELGVGQSDAAFTFGFVVVSLQADGTLFWAYNQGMLVIASSVMSQVDRLVSPSFAVPAVPAMVEHGPLSRSPVTLPGLGYDDDDSWGCSELGVNIPGANCTNYSFFHTGTWGGRVRAIAPALSAPPLDTLGEEYYVYSRYADGDCELGATMCGFTSFGDGVAFLSPSIFLFPVSCLEHIAGAAPTGECYSFMEQLNAADPTAGDWALTYTTFSFQSDGSVHYTVLQGMIPTAVGRLEKLQRL